MAVSRFDPLNPDFSDVPLGAPIPTINAPTNESLGEGQAAPVSGVSVTDSGATSITVTLTDSTGDLSVNSGAGVSGSGTNSLTITGTVSAVNAELATLKDMETAAGADAIVITAVDNTSATASPATITVSASGPPAITVPPSETIGQGVATAISGVSLTETNPSGSETFTVTLTDSHGDLTATNQVAGGSGSTVSGTNSTSLTISGTLAEVNADLTTLRDTDNTFGSDTISVTASDSYGNKAGAQTIAVFANAGPIITAPASEAGGRNQTITVSGVSISESGNTPGETFTATVSDTTGDLSVTNSSGTVSGSGSTTVTITGTLGEVNADLATLQDTSPHSGFDTITVAATDGLGNSAAPAMISVSVAGSPYVHLDTQNETIGQGITTGISGVRIYERNYLSSETFTATLVDTAGVLTVTNVSGASATGSGSTSVTITGTYGGVNAELGTLTDKEATAGTDFITVGASDSFGDIAPSHTISVTTNGLPAISAPATAVTGVDQPTPISGVSLTESGNTAGSETFKVTLTDKTGDLFVTNSGATVTGSGTTSVTISGSFAAVNADLASLADDEDSVGSDTISVAATDSFGNSASTATIAVTTNAAPTVTAPASETIGVGQTHAIPGVSISESPGNTTGETFTATLTDTNGDLSVTAVTGESVSGSGTTSVTIVGTLAQVDATLATLKDTDGTAGSDTISVTGTDSLGNSGTATIAVTVNGRPVISDASDTVLTGQNQATHVTGVSVSETGNTTGETFTAKLTDQYGLLAATTAGVGGGGTINGYGSTSLTITGTLAQVNADLASLTETENQPGNPRDTITLTATDSFGNTSAALTSISVITAGLPTFTVPGPQTVEEGLPSAISGVSLSEVDSSGSETFTVTLTDKAGDLSVTGGGVTGSGTTSVTITGTLAAVNADLATLTDTETATGADTISLSASDSLGNSSTPQTIAVTSDGPNIFAPKTATTGINQNDPIPGVSITETGASESPYTVTLVDGTGDLSVAPASSTAYTVTGSGSTSVTIVGTLAQVNAELATLHDDDATAGVDSLKITATDNLGANTSDTVAVTTNGYPTFAAPSTIVLGQGHTTPISGVSLTESGFTGGEVFTATLVDTAGDLAVTSASGATVTGSGTTSLTIVGSLAAINVDLKSLTDTEATASTDQITLNGSDSFGNTASTVSISVLTNGLPTITAPATLTVGVGQPTAVPSVSLAETGDVDGETFTATVTDTTGILVASGAGVSGSGTTSLTITGSIAQVNSDLSTLTETEPTAGSDTITVGGSDSLGNTVTPSKDISVTTNSLPGITAPATAVIGVTQDAAITGVSLTETGNTTGETFTVNVTDTAGDLSLSTSQGTVTGSGTTSLTISGSLSAVNADLAALLDDEGTAGSDTISISATDSLKNNGSSATIAVTVNTDPHIILPANPDRQTIFNGKAAAITGISVTEGGNTTGETFTVTLTDDDGNLSVSGSGAAVTGSGSTSVTITGSLSQVNADLATLTDTSSGPDTDVIQVAVSDSLGNSANSRFVSVTTNGSPFISIDDSQPVFDRVDNSVYISNVSVGETGNTTGEFFTVTVSDTTGELYAYSNSGGVVTGEDTSKLTIIGTLAAVNNTLNQLNDYEATDGTDIITIGATDSAGNTASPGTVTVVTQGASIVAPRVDTIGVGVPTHVSGVSLSDTNPQAGESPYLVSLTDTAGDLSVTNTSGATVTGSGTTSLTISGSLAAVDAALATLTDTEAKTGTDTITINATDSLGNQANEQDISVNINGRPTITGPGEVYFTSGKARSIGSLQIAETGFTTGGETFTATLSDAHGALTATGAGVAGSGTSSLTITGSLTQVNAALATLKDDEATAGIDHLTVNVSDSLGNSSAPKTVELVAAGQPFFSGLGARHVGQNQSAAISGVALHEAFGSGAETYTVALSDAHGQLSASGAGVSGSGSTSLTITGSLAQVNADLATLRDTDPTAGADSISLSATDSLGGASASASIAVVASGVPRFADTGERKIVQGHKTAIANVGLNETGATASETFTVHVSDAHGLLSASGAGVSGSGSTSLTITGSLTQVKNDLLTLMDTDSTVGTDTISLSATDSYGNASAPTSIKVVVSAAPTTMHTQVQRFGQIAASHLTGSESAGTSLALEHASANTHAPTVVSARLLQQA